MSTPTEKKEPNPIVFRLVWSVVGLVAIIAMIIVYQSYQEAQLRKQQESDAIFDHNADAPAFKKNPPSQQQTNSQQIDSPQGGASLGLRTNLRRAKMVIPDRPHDPEEIPTQEMKEDFLRRREFTISTDAKGLRIADPPQNGTVPAPQNNNDFTIVCIGASESFGWGVPYEESYPAVLAKELNVNVINASAPAGRPGGLVLWAKQNLASLQPDLVIFALRPEYPENDPIPNFAKDMKALAKIAGKAPLVIALPPLSTFDFQFPDIERLYPQSNDVIGSDVQAIQQALNPIPVLGLTATFRTVQSTYQPTTANEQIVLLKEQQGIQWLITPAGTKLLEAKAPPKIPLSSFPGAPPPVLAKEVLLAFEKNPNLREPLFFDGGHPDNEGYALFATTVASWLKEQSLVPEN